MTLLETQGRDALSTRAIATAAELQVPAIYRHFGDKKGLLDAVAELAVAEYLSNKRAIMDNVDPLSLLREGWDLHISFGLSKPAFYRLIYSEPGSPAAGKAQELLREAFVPLADAGRLNVSVDRATHLMQAAGIGVVLTLLAQPDTERDAGLSSFTRELVLSAIVADAPKEPVSGLGSVLSTLGQALAAQTDDTLAELTEPERALMNDWVSRMQNTSRNPSRA